MPGSFGYPENGPSLIHSQLPKSFRCLEAGERTSEPRSRCVLPAGPPDEEVAHREHEHGSQATREEHGVVEDAVRTFGTVIRRRISGLRQHGLPALPRIGRRFSTRRCARYTAAGQDEEQQGDRDQPPPTGTVYELLFFHRSSPAGASRDTIPVFTMEMSTFLYISFLCRTSTRRVIRIDTPLKNGLNAPGTGVAQDGEVPECRATVQHSGHMSEKPDVREDHQGPEGTPDGGSAGRGGERAAGS
jgi:hypothetical protein